MAGSSTVRVDGDVGGQIVVGDHNVVINAQYGSSAAPREEGPPPARRRERPAGRALPRHPAELYGRAGELATVDEWLGAGHLVQVYGPPGIGKTALLRRYAADQIESDRDLIYLPAAGLPVEDMVQELFHACFETEDYKPEPARMRRLMGTVQALLVVDDFEGSPEDLAALADAAPGCDLLVAAVERCPSPEARTLRLGGLPQGAALDLLARELRRTPEGTERTAACELIATVRGHPLTLVQTAAAVRAGDDPEHGGFEADEAARAVGTAARLDETAVRLLRVLSALSPLPVSSTLLDVCAADAGPAAAVATALEALEDLGLVEQDTSGYRGRCDSAVAVLRQAGRIPEAGDLAPALTHWLTSGASRQQAATDAAVIARVLTDAARKQDHTAVRDLARAAAPLLARSLHWGTWRLVLEHGRAAAAALGSAADEAYFAHEEDVRRTALGLAAVAAAAVAGGGVGAGAAAVHNALGAGAKTSAATGRTGLGALATGPAAIGAAMAALIAGGVFFSLADTGGSHTAAAAPPPASTGAAHSAYPTPPTDPKPSFAESSGPRPSVSSPTASSPGPEVRSPGPDGPGQCTPFPLPAPAFGEVTVPGQETHEVVFDKWLPCDDAKTLNVTDRTNWTVRPTDCPPPEGSRICRFTVTFHPRTPGTHRATVTIRDRWGQADLSMEVSGTAVDAAPSTPVVPTAPTEPGDTPSPTESSSSPRPGPTEPEPSTT